MLNIDLLVMSHEEIMLKITSNAEKEDDNTRLTQKQLSERAGV